jgi:pimeloyl-ACP methyl ester carboxylesterase
MKAKTDSDRQITARAVTAMRTTEGVRTVIGLWNSFTTPEQDLRSRAAELTAPTLIVWGRKDIAIPLRAGRATHQAIPGSRFETLNTGHVVFSSDPTGFLAIAEPFLESVSSRVCADGDDTPQDPAVSARRKP